MSTEDKKIRDEKILDLGEIGKPRRDKFAGLFGQHLNEGPFVPIWSECGSEVVKKGNNNSFIALGRDRAGNCATGTGGQGGTGCGSIDLVAGLGGYVYKERIKTLLEGVGLESEVDVQQECDVSFHEDAARIYITEKGNIDKYFGLAIGTERVNMSKFKSAVGIKADHVRLVGREHIKIVTGKARLDDAGTGGERNSQGGKIEFPGKIDLIAGNYTDSEEGGLLSIFGALTPGESTSVKKLQPIPKGDNLKELLERLISNQSQLSKMIMNNTTWLQQTIATFQVHVHESNVPFGPTTPPVAAGISLMSVQISALWKNFLESLILTFNGIIDRLMYLSPLFGTYINSRHVSTT
tara:strand:- start:2159 stop:3214 length:1056 start_codon:yes stop_codon:yes gene_type:complete